MFHRIPLTAIALAFASTLAAQAGPQASLFTEGLDFRQRMDMIGTNGTIRTGTIPEPMIDSALADPGVQADPARKAWAHYVKAVLTMQKRAHADAVGEYEKARSAFAEAKDAWGMNVTDQELGHVLVILGELDRAAPLLQRALRESQELLDTTTWYKTLDALAGVHGMQGDVAAARKEYEEGIRLSRSKGDGRWEAQLLRSLSNTLQRQGDLVQCAEVLRQAERVINACCPGDTSLMMTLRVEQSNLASMQGLHQQSLEKLESVQAYFETQNNWAWATFIRARRAEELMSLGRNAEAVEQARLGLQQARERKLLKEIMDNVRALHLAKAKVGDHRGAYSALLEYHGYRDSVVTREGINAMATMEQAYANEKQQLADSLQHAKTLVDLELGRVRADRMRGGFLFGGLGALLLFGGLWYRLRLISRARREADVLRQRAQESERAKHQFLANMSHEIRTPMNAIMGMNGILLRNEHAPEQLRYLEAIKQSSENLLVILNDILDLSKIEAGKVDLEKVPFDPRKVFAGVMDILQFKAEEQGLKLSSEIASEVPPILVGDPTRLHQVLLNLAGNAVKFTEKGSVTIRAMAKANGMDRILLRVEVIDTGIGIPAEKQELIFKEFDQAYSDTGRKYGGTGLGLAISKRLVELQGGSIGVRSAKGEGSTFHVELPYTIGAEPVAEAAVQAPARRSSLRILLAEDNAFNAIVAQDELADAIDQVQVDVATNGLEAVELMRGNSYDLVLMDVQMPEMNGYEATEAIRALPGAAAATPIIAMTANVMQAELQRCSEAGMVGHIPKPFTREELMNAIDVALRSKLSS